MREIDFGDYTEKQAFDLRSLERLDHFTELNVSEPFQWKRTDDIRGEAGNVIAIKNQEYVLEPGLLVKLRDVAIRNQLTQVKENGQGDVGKFMLEGRMPQLKKQL